MCPESIADNWQERQQLFSTIKHEILHALVRPACVCACMPTVSHKYEKSKARWNSIIFRKSTFSIYLISYATLFSIAFLTI